MREGNRLINTESLALPKTKEPPFGVNSIGEIISDVQGAWVVAAINKLNEKSQELKDLGTLEVPLIDLLIEKLGKVLEPSYSSVIDQSFLLTPSNRYSLEFGFTLGSICRFLAGKEHTKSATQHVQIMAPKEFLPLELLDCLSSLVINEKLLGGKIVFQKMTSTEANFDVVYPTIVKAIPYWKEIAIDQQEISVKECLEAFWGLKDIKLDLLGTLEDSKGHYIFEYKIKINGGEKGNSNKNLFAVGGQSLFNDYLRRKIINWFEYVNDLKTHNSKDLTVIMDEFKSLKSKTQEEFNSVKGAIESKNASISIMKDSMHELEGIINFVSNKEKHLKEENLLWRTRVMALTKNNPDNSLLEI